MVNKLQSGILVYRWVVVTSLLAVGTFAGCAKFNQGKTAKYQTVVANNRHDTATAQQKHREALAILDTLHHACDYAKVERLLNEALVADVTYGPAHNSMGTLYFMQNKLYLAAWEFEYAAKLMPDLAQPFNNLGLVYERVGKYDEAISYYSMALSREPNDPELSGNLVRARMLTGERSPDLKHMVSDLALNHPEPHWQRWARDAVELTKFEKETSIFQDDWRIPDTAPEALPTPVNESDVFPQSYNPLRTPLPAVNAQPPALSLPEPGSPLR